MIEQVFVSGQIGKAVYEQNNRYYVMGLGDFRDPVECRPGDVSFLLDSGAEFSVISGRNINLDDISRVLEFNTQAHRALSMTIGGLDDDLSSESRLLSVEVAEELLQDESIHAFVRARMVARPLPDIADIAGAMNHAESAGAQLAGSIYKEVLESQGAIEVVLEAWSESAPKFFDSIEEVAEGEKVLVETGVFAEMVAALTSSDRDRLNSLVVPELAGAIPRVVDLINAMSVRLLDKAAAARAETAAILHGDIGRSRASGAVRQTGYARFVLPGHYLKEGELLSNQHALYWAIASEDFMQRLFAYALRLANGMRYDAEDLVQETIYRILRYPTNPAHIRSPFGYLLTIMRRLWVAKWRKEGSGKTESLDELQDKNALGSHPAVEPDAFRHLENEELKDRLRTVAGPLTARENELLLLYVEGYKSHEIADQLNEDARIVSSDLNAVISKVRQRLRRRE